MAPVILNIFTYLFSETSLSTVPVVFSIYTSVHYLSYYWLYEHPNILSCPQLLAWFNYATKGKEEKGKSRMWITVLSCICSLVHLFIHKYVKTWGGKGNLNIWHPSSQKNNILVGNIKKEIDKQLYYNLLSAGIM